MSSPHDGVPWTSRPWSPHPRQRRDHARPNEPCGCWRRCPKGTTAALRSRRRCEPQPCSLRARQTVESKHRRHRSPSTVTCGAARVHTSARPITANSTNLSPVWRQTPCPLTVSASSARMLDYLNGPTSKLVDAPVRRPQHPRRLGSPGACVPDTPQDGAGHRRWHAPAHKHRRSDEGTAPVEGRGPAPLSAGRAAAVVEEACGHSGDRRRLVFEVSASWPQASASLVSRSSQNAWWRRPTSPSGPAGGEHLGLPAAPRQPPKTAVIDIS